MENNTLIKHTAQLVEKDFFFENLLEILPKNENEAFENLKKQLAERIAYMLDHDFEVLMQIFYRIDLNEQKVKEAIALANEPAWSLAHLVIEREIQKAQTRMKFRENRLGDWV